MSSSALRQRKHSSREKMILKKHSRHRWTTTTISGGMEKHKEACRHITVFHWLNWCWCSETVEPEETEALFCVCIRLNPFTWSSLYKDVFWSVRLVCSGGETLELSSCSFKTRHQQLSFELRPKTTAKIPTTVLTRIAQRWATVWSWS